MKGCLLLACALAVAQAQFNQGFQSRNPSRHQQTSQFQQQSSPFQQQPSQFKQQPSLFQQQSSQFQQQPRQFQQQTSQYQQQTSQYQQQTKPMQQQRTNVGSCGGKNERTPVPGSCDRYIECLNGTAEEKICPDGLRFNPDLKFSVYPCQYPIDVPCLERASLQPAQATEECPHQFGYYRLGDASHCSGFRNCANGKGHDLECPDGLAFNTLTYQCDWPDLVPDCDAEAFVGFRCPEIPISKELGAPVGDRFYRSEADCRTYFVCVAGRPRRLTCGEESAYDELTSSCVSADEVASCPAELRARAAASRELEQQRLARKDAAFRAKSL